MLYTAERYTSSYTMADSDNVGYKVVAATVVALFLSFSAVILRFIARRYQGMKTYWEDWFIYMALACKLGIDIGGILREFALLLLTCSKTDRKTVLNNGLGRHINTLDLETLVTFAKVCCLGRLAFTS